MSFKNTILDSYFVLFLVSHIPNNPYNITRVSSSPVNCWNWNCYILTYTASSKICMTSCDHAVCLTCESNICTLSSLLCTCSVIPNTSIGIGIAVACIYHGISVKCHVGCVFLSYSVSCMEHVGAFISQCFWYGSCRCFHLS